MPETTGSEHEKYYRSLNYEALRAASQGTIRKAFGAFVPFISKLSENINPFFKGARVALVAAHDMAENILLSASSAKYGKLTDREMFACLKVQETRKVLTSALSLCANYIGDESEEGLEEGKYANEVDPIREALAEVTVALRIISLVLMDS
jgi:hypothetical protein